MQLIRSVSRAVLVTRSRPMTLLVALAVSACDDGYRRGSVKPSRDGKTYLAIADDNGGACGPIKVDDEVWPYKLNVAAPIKAGSHSIECGGRISFEIPPAVVFTFDYWGP